MKTQGLLFSENFGKMIKSYYKSMSTKSLKIITQILLLSVIAVVPFLKTTSLYFPFISGKVYLFRLLVALAFFFWVWFLLTHKNQCRVLISLIFRNFLVVALILFFLGQILVSFFGVDISYSFFSSIDRGDGVFQYGFWLLYFLMLISVFKTEQDWKIFFSVFIAIAFLLSAYSWVNSQAQLEARFGNPAYFASFLLFALGFSLITYERKFFYSPNVNNLLLAAAGFFGLTLVFTYIRGAYAGLLGGIFLFCLLSFLFLRKENLEGPPPPEEGAYGAGKKLANWCGIFLLAGILLISALFSARDTDFVRKSDILSRLTEVVEIWEVPSVRERLLNWNIALKAFKERPVFGWGPENFAVAANKYYDFRIGENEPWFDRAHSQPFDILATGGIVLFSFYIFWILAVFFLIFKIARQQKILSFILASIFLAYLLQGFFLFDTLAVYLGLFPFLAYLVFLTPKSNISLNQPVNQRFISGYLLLPAALFSLFVIYATVIMPYKANAAAFQFYIHTETGFYKETKPYLEKAFAVKSPYTSWELRKMTAWQFMNVLEYKVTEKTDHSKIRELEELYDFLVPEFEKIIEARPTCPSIYHVMAIIYRLGFEKLGKDDLEKAEAVLRKALHYSDLRVEYFNDLAKILLLQGKLEEAEKLIHSHVEKMPVEWGEHFPAVTLGNFYFEAEKYKESLEQYDKAEEAGFQIQQSETVYPRYMLASEALEDYQRIVDMAQKYLQLGGPDADTYFNLSVGYFHLGEKEKAREFFLKAVELSPEYEEYRLFFEK